MYNYRILDINHNYNFERFSEDIETMLDINQQEIIIFLNKNKIQKLDYEKIKENYNTFVELLKNTDIIYLVNFMDNCDNIQPIRKENGYTFYYSKSPNGFYGVVSTRRKWKKVLSFMKNQEEKDISSKLNILVSKGVISAVSSMPRIFDLDIMKLDTDLRKFVSPCRNDLGLDSKFEEMHSLSYNYFLISFAIFIFWMFYFFFQK